MASPARGSKVCQGSRSLGVCARAPAGGCAGAATEPELCTQCVRKRQIHWRASQLARHRTLPLLTRGAGAERRAQNETRMCHCMECCAHGVTERMATDDAVPLTSRGPARRHNARDERRFARREQRVRGECSAALSIQVAAAHLAVDHTRMQCTLVEPCVALTSCDDERACYERLAMRTSSECTRKAVMKRHACVTRAAAGLAERRTRKVWLWLPG